MQKYIFYMLLGVFLLFTAVGISESFKKNTSTFEYTVLEKEITNYLDGQPGIYGLYFIDLNSGEAFGYNAYESFHGASTIKIPLNLYLTKAIEQGELSYTDQLCFYKKFMEGGTGILKNQPLGSTYTVSQLADYSILYSDNVAANMLMDRLGKIKVKDYMRSLGALVVENNRNTTCPYDLALYMQEVLCLPNQPIGAKLLNNLYDTQLKDRIPEPLPTDIKVANKIGTWPPEYTYNDAAYVEHRENPYILTVTCKDTPGYTEARTVIRRLSEMVYQYQSYGEIIK